MLDIHSYASYTARFNVLNEAGRNIEDARKSDRNRPRHDELGRGRHGRRPARRHRQPGRRADHAVGRGVREGRRAARRPGRQASGGHQPREHGVLDQAVHGPEVRRSVERGVARAVQGRARAERRRVGRGARQEILAARNLRDGAAEAEAGGRGLSRREGDRRGHHRAGVLQRRAAAGHQGRRQDCRA